MSVYSPVRRSPLRIAISTATTALACVCVLLALPAITNAEENPDPFFVEVHVTNPAEGATVPYGPLALAFSVVPNVQSSVTSCHILDGQYPFDDPKQHGGTLLNFDECDPDSPPTIPTLPAGKYTLLILTNVPDHVNPGIALKFSVAPPPVAEPSPLPPATGQPPATSDGASAGTGKKSPGGGGHGKKNAKTFSIHVRPIDASSGDLLTLKDAASVLSWPPGISCPGQCTHSFAKGTKVSLRALSGAGRAFNEWRGGFCSVNGTLCVINLKKNASIDAKWFKRDVALQQFWWFVDGDMIYDPTTAKRECKDQRCYLVQSKSSTKALKEDSGWLKDLTKNEPGRFWDATCTVVGVLVALKTGNGDTTQVGPCEALADSTQALSSFSKRRDLEYQLYQAAGQDRCLIMAFKGTKYLESRPSSQSHAVDRSCR